MQKHGHDWHFLSQPYIREAQPESTAPGQEEDVPAGLCLLQKPAQPKAVVGNWEMLPMQGCTVVLAGLRVWVVTAEERAVQGTFLIFILSTQSCRDAVQFCLA